MGNAASAYGVFGLIKVLVVDDHQTVAESLVHVLESQPDFEPVGVAHNMLDGVQLASELAPDVVLMDQRLPDGDGIRGAEVIRLERPETRVLLLTGFVEESEVLRAIEVGCSGYLAKDSPVGDVLDAIRSAHAGDAVLAPELLGRLLPQLTRNRTARDWNLSDREVEVLTLVAGGMSNAEIADTLNLSVHTVRNHIQACLSKLGAHSKLEAVSQAVRDRIIRFT